MRRFDCTPLAQPHAGSEASVQVVGTTAQECGEDDGDDSDEEEEARFEDDTESFMLRKREFNFPGLPPVVVRQDFVCVEGTGGAVWRPSVQFARFVCGEEGRRCLPLEGKSLLEVSSGLGLGAIVAWHLGASSVVATDIDSENGPMALLARNVSANCDRTASSTNRPEPRQSGGSGEEEGGEEEESRRRSVADGDAEREQGVLSPGQGTARRSSPVAGVCVQELRWGDGAQLAAALAKFGGFGPDVVLACDVVFDEALLPALTETLVAACTLATRCGGLPRLCISLQKRNRGRESLFFAGLARRLGGGSWREVHREGDVSVLIFAAAAYE